MPTKKAATKKRTTTKRKKATKKKKSKLTNPPKTRNRGSTGRPSPVFDEKVREDLKKAYSLGAPDKYAAYYADITPRTLDNWKKYAKEEEDEGVQGPYTEFFQSLKHAMGKGVIENMLRVRGGEQGWQGAAWLLERRNPEHFAKQDRTTHVVETPNHFSAVQVVVKDQSGNKEGE